MNSKSVSGFVKIGFLITFAAVSSLSQVRPSATPKPALIQPPGNIQLLEGYRYETRRGVDSFVGSMVRSDGFTIVHDIGRMASNYADRYFPEHYEKLRKQTHLNPNAIETQIRFLENQIEWRRRQKINGADLMVVLLKDSTLIASFVEFDANFVAKVDSNDKIADFFLMVLTYQPTNEKTN